jgi:hypothetical protein
MTGYQFKDVMGKNCRMLFGEKSDKGIRLKVKEAIKKRIDTVEVAINYKKNGQPFWNLIYVSPMINSDGSVQYFFGTHMDVYPLYIIHFRFRRMTLKRYCSILLIHQRWITHPYQVRDQHYQDRLITE